MYSASGQEEPVADAGKYDSGGPLVRNFPMKYDNREKRFVQIGMFYFYKITSVLYLIVKIRMS